MARNEARAAERFIRAKTVAGQPADKALTEPSSSRSPRAAIGGAVVSPTKCTSKPRCTMRIAKPRIANPERPIPATKMRLASSSCETSCAQLVGQICAALEASSERMTLLSFVITDVPPPSPSLPPAPPAPSSPNFIAEASFPTFCSATVCASTSRNAPCACARSVRALARAASACAWLRKWALISLLA